jgi:hypothetical protein
MNTKQRGSAQRGRASCRFGCQRVGCDRISLRRASLRRKIVTNNFGIREMSDNTSRPHQALSYGTPAAAWAAEACPVDLALCLDDAASSPTTPQGQQPQNVVHI